MRNQKRVGLTLVELLVTLAVVLVLASIILPSVKNLLVDRKSTQSATLVRNFIEAARARAIGTNNTVAVVLERGSSIPLDRDGDGMITTADAVATGVASKPYRFISATAYDPLTESGGVTPTTNFAPYNTCIRLSLAERPRPRPSSVYGAWPGNTINVANIRDTATASNIASAFGGGHPQAGYFYLNVPDISGAAQLNFIKQLDLLPFCDISLGGESIRYTVQSIANPHSSGTWIACLDSTSISPGMELSVPPLTPKGSFTDFTVYPKPRPIAGQTITLPRGMCIDLSLSGFAEAGSSATHDRRVRFSSLWLSAGASVPEASDLRPIYLEFGNDGFLKTVWANGTGDYATDLVPSQMVDDVYLHIGKTDQVAIPSLPDPTDPVVPNLFDEKGYVLRVSAKSGSIAAAPVAYFETQAELQGIDLSQLPGPTAVMTALSLSRMGVFGQPLTGQ